MLVVFIVDTKPKCVFKFGHVVATREADIVTPGMTKTRVLSLHQLMNTRIHDTVEGRDMQKGPSFVAIEHNLAELGFYCIEGTLGLGLKTKRQAKN
jgi:hypothetical protein